MDDTDVIQRCKYVSIAIEGELSGIDWFKEVQILSNIVPESSEC
jgi:hypothetical protein